MIRVYIVVALIVASGAFGFFARGWYEKSKQVGIIENKIEERNKDEAAINETVREVEKIKIEYRERIVRIPAADLSGDCPIAELDRVRNEAVKALDPVLFQSPVEVPASAP